MAAGDIYRAKATDLSALAQEETNPQLKDTLEQLVQSYLILAEQAERSGSYQVETHPAPLRLQQQQPQLKDDDKPKE